MIASFPIYRQADQMDCGPACLQMIAKYYGRYYNLPTLRERSFLTHEGVSLLGIIHAAESIGFRTTGANCNMESLGQEARLPLIAHWNQQHFVVLYTISTIESFVV